MVKRIRAAASATLTAMMANGADFTGEVISMDEESGIIVITLKSATDPFRAGEEVALFIQDIVAYAIEQPA